MENMDSSSGWIASPTDLVKFFNGLNGSDTSSGTKLLTGESFSKMLAAPEGQKSKRIWYGMGVVVEDSGRTYWHSGHLEGSTSLLSHDENGYTWAIALNYKVENTDLADVVRFCIRKYLQTEPQIDDPVSAEQPSNATMNESRKPHYAYKSSSVYSDALTSNGRNLVKIMIPEHKFLTIAEEISKKNYRVSWIDAVSYYGVVYFNTIWVKSRDVRWKLYVDLSPSRYQKRFKSKVAQGYRLEFLETYVSKRRLRYAAVFVRDAWPPWVTYHGYTPHQHREHFYRYLEQGYHLAVQSITEYRGKLYVSAIYHKMSLGEVRVRIGLTRADFTEELERQIKFGRILSHVQAYEHRGLVKFGAIWVPQTTSAWAVSHSMTKYTLLYKLQGYAEVNVPLTCVTAYVEDEHVQFAALWL